MAEMIFDCPACKQPVQADDAWAGQQIACPLCQAPMIVPPSQSSSAAPPAEARALGRQLVAVPGQTKLSAGATQKARPASGTGAPLRMLQQKQVKQPKPFVKYATYGVVAVLVLTAGWFAWPFARPYLPFLNPGGNEVGAASAVASGKDAQPAAPAPQTVIPPPAKEIPMTVPAYTLNIADARISDGKVNGNISGTNFVPDLVRLDKLAGLYVLDLRQGAGATPDRGLRVYLQLSPADSPTGHTWTVSQEMKGPPISRVVKLWKTNPKYAAQEKTFTTGFALKLEFGQLTESNTIPGKIYAALPDKEQTVIAGVFTAASTLGGASPTAGQPPAIPNPQVDNSPEFQKRYGRGR
jgi:hypothetical protein